MFAKLDELRNKPKHVRNRYAFWFATSLTICIAAVWATTLPTRLLLLIDPSEDTSSETANRAYFWSSMTASVRSSFATLHVGSVPDQPVLEVPTLEAATSTELIWTEAAKSERIEYGKPARTILIATTSHAIATSTGTTTNVIQ